MFKWVSDNNTTYCLEKGLQEGKAPVPFSGSRSASTQHSSDPVSYQPMPCFW